MKFKQTYERIKVACLCVCVCAVLRKKKKSLKLEHEGKEEFAFLQRLTIYNKYNKWNNLVSFISGGVCRGVSNW